MCNGPGDVALTVKDWSNDGLIEKPTETELQSVGTNHANELTAENVACPNNCMEAMKAETEEMKKKNEVDCWRALMVALVIFTLTAATITHIGKDVVVFLNAYIDPTSSSNAGRVADISKGQADVHIAFIILSALTVVFVNSSLLWVVLTIKPHISIWFPRTTGGVALAGCAVIYFTAMAS